MQTHRYTQASVTLTMSVTKLPNSVLKGFATWVVLVSTKVSRYFWYRDISKYISIDQH